MQLTKDTADKIQLRWMIRRDMSDVLWIESNCFLVPLTEQQIIESIRKRNVVGLVAELNNCIIGYMIYELCKNYVWLLNIATWPVGTGIGSVMMQKFEQKTAIFRRNSIRTVIPDYNLMAHMFFKKNGYHATAVKRNFFDDGADGYVFKKRIRSISPSIDGGQNAKTA